MNIKQVVSKYPFWLLLAWFVAATVLAMLLQPVSSWRDGPEFSLTGWDLGIAHPAGFPLYSSLAWIWNQIPIGNIAFRSHSFSLLTTMLAAITLYHVAISFIQQVYRRDVTSMDRNIAGFISICWLAMPSQIENSVQAEVYSLHALFTFIIIKLLIDYIGNHQSRYLILASFLAGLGAGNHVTLGVLIFALLIAGSIINRWSDLIKNAGASVLAGLYGLTVYLYLPIRSSQNPIFDWGNTETWERFWNHVTDKKDAATHFSSVASDGSHPGMDHFLTLYDWVGPVTVIAVLMGWVWLIWRRPRLSFLILSWVIFLFIFFLDWISSTVLTGALGMLLMGLIPVFKEIALHCRRQLFSILAFSTLATTMFMPLFNASISFAAQRGEFLSREIVASEYFSLPYRATILAGRGNFHLLSLANLERARPDVSIVPLAYIFRPNYFRPIMEYDVPHLTFPGTPLPQTEAGNIEGQLSFLNELIESNSSRSSFYAEMDEDYLSAILNEIEPDHGLWAKITSQKSGDNIDCSLTQKVIMKKLYSLHESKELLHNVEAERFLSPQIFSWINDQLSSPEPKCASSALNLGLWWLRWMNPPFEAQAALYNDFGISFAKLGYDRSARTMFLSSWESGFPDGELNLGIWYEKHGDDAQALHHYRETFLETGNENAYLSMRKLTHRRSAEEK